MIDEAELITKCCDYFNKAVEFTLQKKCHVIFIAVPYASLGSEDIDIDLTRSPKSFSASNLNNARVIQLLEHVLKEAKK